MILFTALTKILHSQKPIDMKTKIILLFAGIIILNSCATNAVEEKNQIIVYNFNDGKYDSVNFKLKQKIPTIFQIKNINPLAYSIVVESADKVIAVENKDAADATEAAKNAEKVSLVDLVQETITIENNTFGFFSSAPISPEDEKSLKKANDDLIQTYESLKNLEIDKKNLVKVFNENNFKVTSDSTNFDENLKKADEDIALYKRKINALEDNKKYLLKRVNNASIYLAEIRKNISEINDEYSKFIKSANEIKDILIRYNNFLDKIYQDNLTQESFHEMTECVNIKDKNCFGETVILNKVKMNDYYSTITNFDTKYQEFVNSYNKFEYRDNLYNLALLDTKYKPYIDYVLKEYSNLKLSTDSIYKKFNILNIKKKLNNVEILYDKLENEKTYTFNSAPIQGIEDYLEFNILINQKYSNTNAFIFAPKKSFKYFSYLRGGIRFDFSVGTVFDFGEKNKFYEIVKDTIQKISNNKFNPTLAGIFHASLRRNGNFAPGFSIGGSLDIQKFNINSLFIGPSLLIGKRDKIIFTAGPSFRQISELKLNYKENSLLPVGSTTNVTDLMTNNFKIGWFIGVSYNLTNKQKDLIKIPN